MPKNTLPPTLQTLEAFTDQLWDMYYAFTAWELDSQASVNAARAVEGALSRVKNLYFQLRLSGEPDKPQLNIASVRLSEDTAKAREEALSHIKRLFPEYAWDKDKQARKLVARKLVARKLAEEAEKAKEGDN